MISFNKNNIIQTRALCRGLHDHRLFAKDGAKLGERLFYTPFNISNANYKILVNVI
jgi:hypothetical protein